MTYVRQRTGLRLRVERELCSAAGSLASALGPARLALSVHSTRLALACIRFVTPHAHGLTSRTPRASERRVSAAPRTRWGSGRHCRVHVTPASRVGARAHTHTARRTACGKRHMPVVVPFWTVDGRHAHTVRVGRGPVPRFGVRFRAGPVASRCCFAAPCRRRY